jgi:hypothetical protein
MKQPVNRRPVRKVALRHETIRHLSPAELRRVEGGATSSLGTLCLTFCKACDAVEPK